MQYNFQMVEKINLILDNKKQQFESLLEMSIIKNTIV